MKNTTPTGAQFKAYEGMFAYFNRRLFAGELPGVILNFSRHRRALGFFAPKRWERGEGDKAKVTHEISINPATLKTRPPAEVASTLVHEMTHLWQEERGEPSRTGYHNKEWSAKMDAIGLRPTDDGTPDGKKVGQHMTHLIVPGGAFDKAFGAMAAELTLPWACSPELDGDGAKKKPAARNKVKYSCGCANVWGKPGLSITCEDCGDTFEADGEE